MNPQEQWDGPIQDAIREHDKQQEQEPGTSFPIDWFKRMPNGGTVYTSDWFRRAPNGGGTVFRSPGDSDCPDTPEETQ